MEKVNTIPILVPIAQEEFWNQMRAIVSDEINKFQVAKPEDGNYQTAGLTYKPLFKITEVCNIFNVSRQTIYEWIKHGKLKPYKVRSRLYFLWNDIQAMLTS